MVTDHGEHHGEREISVVDGTLLTPHTRGGVGLTALALGAHELALAWNDHEQHVGDHDGAERGTEEHERTAAAEELTQPPGQERRQRGQHDAEHTSIARQRRTAQPIVGEPAHDEHTERNDDRRGLGERGDRGVDQVGLGSQQIQQGEECKARQPRRVSLPVEPMQRWRQFLRGEAVLQRAIEAPAVHRPQFACDAGIAIARVTHGLQVVVQPYEVERGADPGNAGNHVQPAQEQVAPIEEVVDHGVSTVRS